MRLTKWTCAAFALLLPLGCGGSSTTPAEPGPSGTNLGDEPTVDPAPTPEPPKLTKAQMFGKECRAGLETAKQKLPAILSASGERNEANTLVPLNHLSVDLNNAAGMAELFSEVHPDAAIRAEASKCKEDIAEFGASLSRNAELFAALSKLDTKALDADAKRLVEHELRDFRRAGVDKDDATKARLKTIDAELTTLSSEFGKNIRTDVRSIKVKAEDLAGMPADWIAGHKASADGLITVTTDYPDYIPFMNYADSTAHRRELYLLFKSRGGEANEELLRKVLTLRAEKSKLLGYANWGDYITEDKMVGSAKNAEKFIAKVVKSASKKARKDYRELLSYKRKNIDRKAKLVEDFEKSYIENKLKSTKYNFDSQAMRAYYPYAKVKAGLLDITGKVYGLRYEKAADAKLWHQDVEAHDVYRIADGVKLGRIYLDMHPRDGKYKHAAQFPYKPGAKGIQMPEGVLVCNFPNPRTDGDALMEHAQVETMFHEFGHLMHHVLGGHQKWVSQSGVATEWDFVEAPSQMFEEWANSHPTLALFAKHHKTGEVIPKKLVASMRKASTFGTGTLALQQMFYASVSMGFHTEDPAKLNMREYVKKLQNKLTPFRYLDGTMFHSNFGHLMGYSAVYYTYMWSEVIAKDLLTPFKKRGLMDPALTASYRDKVLVPGGTQDAAALVKSFLGRDFNYRAFENYLAGR